MTQVALVTGASSGLGAEFARKLAAEGRALVLVARRADKLEELAQELRGQHKVEVFVEPSDLAAPGAVPNLMASLAAKGLAVETLINNAGFALKCDFATHDIARQTEMINLNCTALTALTHAVLPGMIARKSGRILNVASTAAFQAGPLMAVYYATKAYVLSFSEAIHEEVKQHGIHVSCLCPGPTQTEFSATAGVGATTLFKNAGLPDKVVADGLAALSANKAFTVSGLLNKIIAQSTRIAPRLVTRKLAGLMQK